jgi:NitT/TauT family transport system substrate-binding protein
MQMLHSRRSFLASLSLAGAANLLDGGDSLAQERPPEITTIRIPSGSLICNAPTYIADELLRAEGFTDIQHVPVTPERSAGPPEPMERGELDFGMVYTPPMIAAIEAGSPATVLAGVHIGCNSLFAHEGIRSFEI